MMKLNPHEATRAKSAPGRLWAIVSGLALVMAVVPALSAQAGSAVSEQDVSDTFTGPGVSVGGVIQNTTFSITKAPGSSPGEVSVGDGSSTAIPTSAAGDVRIPETVRKDGQQYRVTSIADNAFRGAVSITSTGLAENRSVTSIGDFAYGLAFSITSTGLATNELVTHVGTGAFASDRALRSASLPPGLESSPSIPFTSVANLQSLYVPAPFARAQRVGLTKSLPVYYRSGVAGWDASHSSFSGLAIYGSAPNQLAPLSEVRVVGGRISISEGTTANPFHDETGLFAGPGVKPDGSTGSAADVVTITADDSASFTGWRVSGAQLTPEQLASPTVSFPMGTSDVSVEVATGIDLDATVTPRCIGGKVYLYLTVKNTGTSPVSLQLTSDFGSTTVTNLASAKSTAASWNTRLRTITAGLVAVDARTADGQTGSTTAAFAAFACGLS